MDKDQQMVQDFHVKYGCEWNNKPTVVSTRTLILRCRLIMEEAAEFVSGASNRNLTEMLDALCDLRYVINGAAVVLGVDLSASKYYSRCKMQEVNPCLPNDFSLIEHIQTISMASSGFVYAISKDIEYMTRSLCNINEVIDLAAIALKIDLDPLYAEVHRSNMTKDGGGQDAGGKVVKGPNFEPPNLEKLIEAQRSNREKTIETQRK